MCRKSNSCALLEEQPSAWSRTSPLPPPVWFGGQLQLFRSAAEAAANGDRPAAIAILGTIRSDEMRFWFDEHGQMAGMHRVKKLNLPVPVAPSAGYDVTRNVPSAMKTLVYQRDRYTCRYCGLRLVAERVLRALERAIGSANFRTQGTNAQQHGIVHGFKIVADHVIPHTLGGRTSPENLVSACPACNYGKYNYTVEQMGMDDPRGRPPPSTDWDGLTSLLAGLKKYAPP